MFELSEENKKLTESLHKYIDAFNKLEIKLYYYNTLPWWKKIFKLKL